MNFYTLIDLALEIHLADVVEFDDCTIVVKYSDSTTIPKFYNSIGEFINECVNEKVELLKDGVFDY